MDSIVFWKVLNHINCEIKIFINKIIIFGNNGSEVIFSTRDGKVYGFGNNSFGELGFGHKTDVNEPQNIVDLNDKQIVGFNYGSTHVLAKTITGKLYSWGDNSYGQLGIGTYKTDYRPKLIHSLSDKCVIDMSCGQYYTLVLTDNNQLYGFGDNINGQIGCGNTSNQLKPIKIIGFNNETVVSISCGAYHSLALTQTGNVYSWGRNRWGRLGIGNHKDIKFPTKIVVSNGLSFKRIVCGSSHSLILSVSGDVYGFGSNIYGSLGIGNTNHSSVPIKINGLKNVKDIASHFRTNISMAKLEDNTCHVWGQCLSGDILKPLATDFQTFNDLMAFYSIAKLTVRPIECALKSNTIIRNISDKFNDKNFSDIVFKVGDKQIFVNKFILRVNSKYFRNKYSSKFSQIIKPLDLSVDGIENIEVINHYSYEVFYSYLKYLYTYSVEIENQYLDQLLILSIDHKEEDLLLECSERLFSSDNNLISFENLINLMIHSIDKNMNEVKVKCIDRIKSVKNIGNICTVYEVSIKYELNELMNNCIEFVKGLHIIDKQFILNTESYKKLSKDMRLEICEKMFIIK